MEELLKKVVNLGIGAVKTLEENLSDTFSRAESGINEMISKGETASDERSAKVKQFVDDMMASVKEYETKATEVTQSLTATLKEFDPSGTAEELRAKVDELAGRIRSNIGSSTESAASAASKAAKTDTTGKTQA